MTLLLLGLAPKARAEVPGYLPIQGNLLDAKQAPLDGNVTIVVELYSGPDRSSPKIFEETHSSVEVKRGAFSIYVGDQTRGGGGMDLTLFQQNSLVFAGLTINGEPLEPLMQLGTVPFAAVSKYSENARTLNGKSAEDFLLREEAITLAQLPPSFADGDQDSLGGLTCADGQMPKRSATGWNCGATAWTELLDMPAGFADGIDNDSGGDITEVVAGAGLTGGADSGKATLALQPCSAGQILRFADAWECATPSYLSSAGGTVQGTVKAKSYDLLSPRTEYVSIPGLAFTGSGGALPYLVARTGFGNLYFGGSSPAGKEVWVAAPVTVPHGSTITKVTCAFTQTDKADVINGNIQGSNDAASGAVFKTWFTFSEGAEGVMVGTTGNIALPVDMTSTAYYIEVYLRNAAGGDSFGRVSLNRCTITYTRASL